MHMSTGSDLDTWTDDAGIPQSLTRTHHPNGGSTSSERSATMERRRKKSMSLPQTPTTTTTSRSSPFAEIRRLVFGSSSTPSTPGGSAGAPGIGGRSALPGAGAMDRHGKEQYKRLHKFETLLFSAIPQHSKARKEAVVDGDSTVPAASSSSSSNTGTASSSSATATTTTTIESSSSASPDHTEAENGMAAPPEASATLNTGTISVDHYGLRFDHEKFRTVMEKRPSSLRSLLVFGIPNNAMRREIWIRLCEAHDLDQRFPGLYEKLANNPSTIYENGIRKDVHRTFPQFELFEKDNRGQKMLFNVLKAISFFDTSVGYVQGMGFIAGFFLLQGMSEEECFWCLVQLFNHKRFGFKDVVREGLPKLRWLLYCIDRILQRDSPSLHFHLSERIGAEPEMYASSFFLTLCCCRFPFGTLQRIFDVFLFDGWNFILQVVVAIVKHNGNEIKKASLENVIPTLYESCLRIEPETMIQAALAVRLSDKDIKQWAKEYETSLHPSEQEEIDKKRSKWLQWHRTQSFSVITRSNGDTSVSAPPSPSGGNLIDDNAALQKQHQQQSTSLVRNIWSKLSRVNSFGPQVFNRMRDGEDEEEGTSIN